MQSWNYGRGTPRLVNYHSIVEIFVVEIFPIVGGGWHVSPAVSVGGLGEADGIVLELCQGIRREVVEIIVREVALSLCVGSHACSEAFIGRGHSNAVESSIPIHARAWKVVSISFLC